jgi:hypothetical protein
MHMEARLACFLTALGLVGGLLFLSQREEPTVASAIHQDVIVQVVDTNGAVHYTDEVPASRAWNFIHDKKLSNARILFVDDPDYLQASLVPYAERTLVSTEFDPKPPVRSPEPELTPMQRISEVLPPQQR